MAIDKSRKFCVYKHTAPNGKVYIGITSQLPQKRWGSGKKYQFNRHFTNAVEKYGWDNIKHEIVKEGLCAEDAAALEVELIAKHKSINPRYGYNLSTGGLAPATGCKTNLGSHRTPEQRAHMSETQKQMVRDGRNKVGERSKIMGKEWARRSNEKMAADPDIEQKRKQWAQKMLKSRRSYKGEQNPNYGKKATEATKAIWHEQRAGRKLTDEWKEKIKAGCRTHKSVKCIETGTAYNSVTEAAQAGGTTTAAVSHSCKHGCCAAGMHYAYVEVGDDEQT